MTTDELLDIFYQVVKDICESITLPTGKNLMPSFFAAVCMTALTVVCGLLGKPVFLDWRGELVATLSLGVLVFIERRGMNEVSRLYRAAKSRVVAAASRAARPGAGEQAGGAVDAGEPDVQED